MTEGPSRCWRIAPPDPELPCAASLYIAGDMIFVPDANLLVAALRSPAGRYAELMRRALLGQLTVACSVPWFMDYEAVLLRPDIGPQRD